MFRQIRKSISVVILTAFVSTSVNSPAYAQVLSADQMPFMPKPGTMVHLSPEYTPAYLKGIVIHPENALKFDFIIYKGDKELTDAQKREEYTKLTKYFLASLAIPDDDQWVNLSPYEKDRIIKDDFGKTEMGRDLLAQDYMLKQITASLIYPEDNLGKKFWAKVYAKAQEQFGTTNIPVNTFNKVWVLPDDALIYEKGNTAYVLRNHLRVMLEEDYLSLQKHSGITSTVIQKNPVILSSAKDLNKINSLRDSSATPQNDVNKLASQIVRAIVLPELQREVNEDKNFATLRQVYSGMLLAAWYKRALKESLLSKIYANKAKVKGVEYTSRAKQSQQNLSPDQIYHQYLKAYKKGVFNFIKEDVDKYTNEVIPRKYFSGGAVDFAQAAKYLGVPVIHFTFDRAAFAGEVRNISNFDLATVATEESKVVVMRDAAMTIWRRALLVAVVALLASPTIVHANLTPNVLSSPIQDISESVQVQIKLLEEMAERDFKDENDLKTRMASFEKGKEEIWARIHNAPTGRLNLTLHLFGQQVSPEVYFDSMREGLLTKIYNELSVRLGAAKTDKKRDEIRKIAQGILERYSAQMSVFDRARYNYLVGSDHSMIEKPALSDAAMNSGKNKDDPFGGIDFNSANLNLQIKRDGHGVPLPISRQNLENIHIDGLVPIIIDIKPANSLPIFAELQSNVKSVNG